VMVASWATRGGVRDEASISKHPTGSDLRDRVLDPRMLAADRVENGSELLRHRVFPLGVRSDWDSTPGRRTSRGVARAERANAPQTLRGASEGVPRKGTRARSKGSNLSEGPHDRQRHPTRPRSQEPFQHLRLDLRRHQTHSSKIIAHTIGTSGCVARVDGRRWDDWPSMSAGSNDAGGNGIPKCYIKQSISETSDHLGDRFNGRRCGAAPIR
jgi:hypothetical protein